MNSVKNLLADERNEVVSEFTQRGRGGDIEMSIVLLRLDLAERVRSLGIIQDDTILQDLFSDEDTENWTTLENAWANTLRGTAREIERRLDVREELLRKEKNTMTQEDEQRYKELGEEIQEEIQEAIESIERTTQSAIDTLLKKTKNSEY